MRKRVLISLLFSMVCTLAVAVLFAIIGGIYILVKEIVGEYWHVAMIFIFIFIIGVGLGIFFHPWE